MGIISTSCTILILHGVEEEHVGGLAGVGVGPARVEDVERRPGAAPWPESLERLSEEAAGQEGLVDVGGVAPRDGEGPVGGAVVADGLLEEARVVAFRGGDEVSDGVSAVLVGENGVYGVYVVKGHEWCLRV